MMNKINESLWKYFIGDLHSEIFPYVSFSTTNSPFDNIQDILLGVIMEEIDE